MIPENLDDTIYEDSDYPEEVLDEEDEEDEETEEDEESLIEYLNNRD